MTALSKIGEFGLIERFKRFQNLSRHVVTGMGDDAAVLEYDKTRYQLLTTDMMVEGRHFWSSMCPEEVGYKALATNISDIAAMGGVSRSAVISLGVPGKMDADYLQKIYQGFYRLARKFGVSLVGGDTVASDKIIINVALLGEVEKKNLVLRSGAQAGDVIFVSGGLGNSFKSGRHLTFVPRTKEARFLVEHFKPSAMIDISDGLAGDLGHVLKASCVGAELDERFIPVHQDAMLDQALYEGEDYELLFTLSPVKAQRLARSKRGDFCFYPIGVIVPGRPKLTLRRKNGKNISLKTKAFSHF
ncbi:MAG: thiamine-phosphate kinase [Candidatus Omnitrophica bacterium]|nr:thiamine-phosphate kinase [Candidatus Omnitrophota bacterium]